jgi:hypothetical protein
LGIVTDRPVGSPTITGTAEPAAPAGVMTVRLTEVRLATYAPTPPM